MKNAILRPFTSLTGQIYLFFILIFCIAFTIAVILPSFDSRNYSLIESRELNDYNSIDFFYNGKDEFYRCVKYKKH